jgi:hypothetical protein
MFLLSICLISCSCLLKTGDICSALSMASSIDDPSSPDLACQSSAESDHHHHSETTTMIARTRTRTASSDRPTGAGADAQSLASVQSVAKMAQVPAFSALSILAPQLFREGPASTPVLNMDVQTQPGIVLFTALTTVSFQMKEA